MAEAVCDWWEEWHLSDVAHIICSQIMARGKVTTRSNVAVLKQTYCKQSIRLLSQNYIYISLLYKSHSHFFCFIFYSFLIFLFCLHHDTHTHTNTLNWRSFPTASVCGWLSQILFSYVRMSWIQSKKIFTFLRCKHMATLLLSLWLVCVSCSLCLNLFLFSFLQT